MALTWESTLVFLLSDGSLAGWLDARACCLLSRINTALRVVYENSKTLLWMRCAEGKALLPGTHLYDAFLWDAIQLVKKTLYCDPNTTNAYKVKRDFAMKLSPKERVVKMFVPPTLTLGHPTDDDEVPINGSLLHKIAEFCHESTPEMFGWIICLTQAVDVDIVLLLTYWSSERTTCLHKAVEKLNYRFVRSVCRLGGKEYVSMHHDGFSFRKNKTILWQVVALFDSGATPEHKERLVKVFDELVECGGPDLVLRLDGMGENVLITAVEKKWWHAIHKLILTDMRVLMTERPVHMSLRRWANYKRCLLLIGKWPMQ